MAIFDKKQPGEPFRIAATEWNAMLDAAEAERARSGEVIDGEGDSAPSPALFALVRNNHTEALPQNAVVALREPIILPTANLAEFKRRPTFEAYLAEEEDLTSPTKPAILLEPLRAGGMGKAQIAGVVVCQVNMVASGHRWADLVTGQTYLQSAASGGVEILWVESGTGVKWARVQLKSRKDAPLAGITVAEADGSPSHAGITTVLVNSGSGFQLSQPAAGQVLIDLLSASPDQIGVVNAGSQTFGGTKTLKLNSAAAGLIQLNVDSYPYLYVRSTQATGYGRTYVYGGGIFIGVEGFDSAFIRAVDNNGDGSLDLEMFGGGAGGQATLTKDGDEHVFAICSSSSPAVSNPKFAVGHFNGSTFDYSYGATDTQAGLIFKGGLLVGGSFQPGGADLNLT